MSKLILTVVCVLAVAGCSDTKNTPVPNDRDNTGVNARDRDSSAKTPLDQKENKGDIETTASIRKKIIGTDMSTDAKNVKIITENGHVTLRGPVKSEDEKMQIEKTAVQVAGEGHVDNRLEVTSGR